MVIVEGGGELYESVSRGQIAKIHFTLKHFNKLPASSNNTVILK